MVDVNNNHYALNYASKKLKNNYNVVMTAINKDGIFLKYASKFLKII